MQGLLAAACGAGVLELVASSYPLVCEPVVVACAKGRKQRTPGLTPLHHPPTTPPLPTHTHQRQPLESLTPLLIQPGFQGKQAWQLEAIAKVGALTRRMHALIATHASRLLHAAAGD